MSLRRIPTPICTMTTSTVSPEQILNLLVTTRPDRGLTALRGLSSRNRQFNNKGCKQHKDEANDGSRFRIWIHSGRSSPLLLILRASG